MSKTNSLHYELCCLGAKFLKSRKNSEPFELPNKYVVVELVTLTAENPDIWATNGYHTTLVEVKTSHSDFIADQKKWVRSSAAEQADKCLGNFRYYLCPEGVISLNEIPENWGLLVYNGKKIVKVKNAKYTKSSTDAELLVLTSIMRRCGIKQQIFNFRQYEKENSKEDY